METGTFSHDGVIFHYDLCGDGKKHIVLQHGLSDYAPCWGDMFTDLCDEGYQVAMMDARGHGRSGKPDNGYNLKTLTGDMIAFIDYLDLDRPVVIGHSMGGSMTIHAAANYPEKIRAAVLIDPVFEESFDVNIIAQIEMRKRQYMEFKKMSHKEIVDYAMSKHPDWKENYIKSYAMSKIFASEKINQIIMDISEYWKEDLKKNKNPTLLITAEREKGALISQKTSSWIHKQYPDIEILHVPGVGHSVHRENYSLVYQEIRELLKTQF